MMGIPSRDVDPDYINDDGVKWWQYDYATKALRSQNSMIGVPIPKAAAWLVEMPDVEAVYVITEDDKVIYDGPTIEGLFVAVDMLRKARE